MTQAKPPFQTIEEYLDYDDGTDTRYELVDGVLVEMGAEKPINTAIAVFLIGYFLQLGIPVSRIGIKHLIAGSSSRVTARDPDLMIHSEASRDAMNQTAQLFLSATMPAPLLVIEVVSPGEPGSDNYNRDYIEKPREYAARGISEYWLIDPNRAVVLVLTLQNDRYQTKEFRNNDRLVSPTFPNLQLTAAQILEAGA
ncbi:Uma2 family endonuclease [Leptolyngbya sp. FACHB-17]|uniref:Uma2 family endonuclease n=1 Tax=unclassified Leptolyngbya TaxID=2650499 RepID=UPI0016811FB8|nr:Uma2 family endonuclease [Leptolyngbya sp. FACHB-17]MBD2078912.1 Uma2 family endonuclease [Leptolyngbya sp. FACHB-17]